MVTELDLSLDDMIDEPEAAPEPVAVAPARPAPVAAPQPMHPQYQPEERPMTLFEKMMNLSRPKPRTAPPAPTTLAPEPTPSDAGPEVSIPPFFKKQANN